MSSIHDALEVARVANLDTDEGFNAALAAKVGKSTEAAEPAPSWASRAQSDS